MFRNNELFNSTMPQWEVLDTVFEKLPDLVFIYDLYSKHVVVCNAAFLKELKGYNLSIENIDCTALRALIHTDDWQNLQNTIQKVISISMEECVELNFRCKNEIKGYQYYNTKLSVFEKKGDSVQFVLGITRNNTDTIYNDAQKEMYKTKLQDVSFIASQQMRHEYAKIQSIITLFDNKFITDAERIDLIKEAKKSIQIINSSIFKLNHKLSFSQTDDYYNKIHNGNNIKKIVFVDDDVLTNVLNKKIVQALLPEILVEVYLSIEDALIELQKMELSQTLIFLDINFPGKGGWEFLDEYAKISDEANIIVLSSSIDNRDREKAREYKSVIDYITKPLSFEFIKTFFEEFQLKNH